jgi:hypothetical protein
VVQVGDVLDERDVFLQQSQRPAGIPRRRLRARQGDQSCLDLTGDRRWHRRMLALLALDRGPDVAAGLGEALGDQPQRFTRDPDPGRDHLFRVHLTGRGVQREQHPRPHDHRRRMDTCRGHPDQLVTIPRGQPDRPLFLRGHENRPCPAGERPATQQHSSHAGQN